jgi:hypothetical protein
MKSIYQICLLAFVALSLVSASKYRQGKSHSKTSDVSRKAAAQYETSLKKKDKTNRPKRETTTICPFNQNKICDATYKYQSFDGTCNNLRNPLYGAGNTPYTRFLKPNYDDSIDAPRTKAADGGTLPNPRQISTTIVNDDLRNDIRWTHLFAIFGIKINLAF